MLARVRDFVLICPLLVTGCGFPRAARLLEDSLRPASELTEGITEDERQIAGVRVRIFRPTDTDKTPPAILLVPGAVVDGIDDERFIALARAMAKQGFEVGTPCLPTLRTFEIHGYDPERIATIALEFAGDRKVALAGISIGGSYSLVAAARPEMKDKLSCVFSFGGYADLPDLLELWMTAPPTDAQGVLDPLHEGRQLVLQGNKHRLDPGAYAAAMASDAALTKEQADRLLAPIRKDLEMLTPAAEGRVPACPVFLLHGKEDPIVPSTDAAVLRDHLKENGAKVRLLVTGLFSHVDAEGHRPSLWRVLPMLRFIAAFLRAAES
ncbi:MAG: alpha/beta hydrolase family protein [Planctomycetota bacterium]